MAGQWFPILHQKPDHHDSMLSLFSGTEHVHIFIVCLYSLSVEIQLERG